MYTIQKLIRNSFLSLLVLLPVAAAAQEETSQNITPNIFVRDIQATVSATNQELKGSFTIVNEGKTAVGGINYIVMLFSPLPKIPEGELFADNPIIYSREYVSANISLASGEKRVVDFTHAHPLLPEGTYRVNIQTITQNGREMGW